MSKSNDVPITNAELADLWASPVDAEWDAAYDRQTAAFDVDDLVDISSLRAGSILAALAGRDAESLFLIFDEEKSRLIDHRAQIELYGRVL